MDYYEDPYELHNYEFSDEHYGRIKEIDDLLENDEYSFEEAAFMTGYCDFA